MPTTSYDKDWQFTNSYAGFRHPLYIPQFAALTHQHEAFLDVGLENILPYLDAIHPKLQEAEEAYKPDTTQVIKAVTNQVFCSPQLTSAVLDWLDKGDHFEDMISAAQCMVRRKNLDQPWYVNDCSCFHPRMTKQPIFTRELYNYTRYFLDEKYHRISDDAILLIWDELRRLPRPAPDHFDWKRTYIQDHPDWAEHVRSGAAWTATRAGAALNRRLSVYATEQLGIVFFEAALRYHRLDSFDPEGLAESLLAPFILPPQEVG